MPCACGASRGALAGNARYSKGARQPAAKAPAAAAAAPTPQIDTPGPRLGANMLVHRASLAPPPPVRKNDSEPPAPAPGKQEASQPEPAAPPKPKSQGAPRTPARPATRFIQPTNPSQRPPNFRTPARPAIRTPTITPFNKMASARIYSRTFGVVGAPPPMYGRFARRLRFD